MQSSPSVSIVCPVYNTHAYLPALVASLECQTLLPVQVVFVDDGSTDGSGAYLDAVAARHPGWTVLHRENAGVARARIAGMAEATGTYLGFVDSDDFYAPNYIRCLVDLLETSGADCAVADMIDHYPDGLQVVHSFHGDRSPFLISPSVSNKLFRRASVAGLGFPPGCWYEDLYFFHHFLLRRPTLVYTDATAYHCHCRAESIMSNCRAEKNRDILQVLEAIREAAVPVLAAEAAGKGQADATREKGADPAGGPASDSAVASAGAQSLADQLEASVYDTVLHATVQRLYAMPVPEKKPVIREMRAYVRQRYPGWWRSRVLHAMPLNRRLVILFNGFGLPGLSAALVRLKQRLRGTAK